MGKEYLIEHIVQEYKDRMEAEAFNVYTSEMIRGIANSIFDLAGGEGFSKSWEELKHYKPETRSPEEIKSHMLDILKGQSGGEN